MNKKVLSAILFSALFACTGTFTSCIDNDEPEGIENLRGAKAELLRAKVAVEQANATLILAKAEVKKAEAAKTLAEARIKEAVAAKKEAEAEAEAARTEEEKARIEAQIAKYQQQIEEDALEHQQTMVGLQKFLAETQRAYEVALAQIEIAKATCTDADKVTLAQLEFAVSFYKGQVETLAGEVAGLEETYYNLTVGYKYSEELMVEAAEKAVADAEQELKDAQDDLAYWTSYQVGDETVEGWMTKVAEYEDSITLLQDLESKKLVELDVLKQSEEYALLVKAMLDATAAYNGQTVDSVYSFEMLAQTPYTVTLAKHGNPEKTEICSAYVTAAQAKAAGTVDAIAYLKNVNANNAGYIANLQMQIDSYTTERQYWLDSIAKMDDVDKAAADKAANDAVTAWSNALAAYTGAKDISTDAMFKAGTTTSPSDTGKYVDYMEACIAAEAKKNSGAYTEAEYNEAILLAKQKFADAIVAYYNTLPANQVTFNSITLGTEVDGDMIYSSKTAKEWLSDASLKHKNLDKLYYYFNKNMNALWGVGATAEVKNTNGSVKTATEGAFATWTVKQTTAETFTTIVLNGGTPSTLYGKLLKASYTAFGDPRKYSEEVATGSTKDYLRNKPTLEDVKYVFANNNGAVVGVYGNNLLGKDVEINFIAKNYKAIIENLKAAKAYWESKWNILVADRAAAKKAKEDAEKAEENYAKQWTDREEELDELQNRIDRLTNMTNILAAAIKAYLPDEYTESVYDVEEFADFLQEMIGAAEDDIYNAKVDLAAAQANKELALDGKYDALSIAKENLDKKLAELTEAQAKLDEATANLKKGLEIIAAMNAAE